MAWNTSAFAGQVKEALLQLLMDTFQFPKKVGGSGGHHSIFRTDRVSVLITCPKAQFVYNNNNRNKSKAMA